MNHYEILGVDRNASRSEIKSAYRKLASTPHPDKGGGTEEFQDIQKAYDILYDEDSRLKYNFELDNSFEIKLANEIKGLFSLVIEKAIENNSPSSPIYLALKELNAKQSQLINVKKGIRFKNRELAKRNRKIKKKSEGNNLFKEVIYLKRKIGIDHYKEAREQLKLIKTMIELVSDYDYEVDAKDILNSINTQTFIVNRYI